MAARKKAVKPRVVTAVGASANVHGNPALAEKIEQAMSQAVVDATKRGVTDPDEIRAAMLAARDEILGA